MTPRIPLIIALGCAITTPIHAAGIAPKVKSAPKAAQKTSKTFTDILARVSLRDPDSGAILRVKARNDAPTNPNWGLNFSMVESKRGYVDIVISLPGMTRNVYESYRLAVDNNIRAELAKFKLMEVQRIEKASKHKVAATQHIKTLTKGSLKYGMTPEEVIAMIGPITYSSTRQIQEGGRSFAETDVYLLEFYGGLVGVELKKKPSH